MQVMGMGTFAHYCKRAADIRLDLTGHAVLSFN